MSEAVNYFKYTEKIREFINYVLEKYFDDGPGNLREILTNCELEEYYPKFYSYRTRKKNFSQQVNYETLMQFSLLDPDGRTPLEIRAHLLGEKIKDFHDMSKSELIEQLIDARNRKRLVRKRSKNKRKKESSPA